MYVIKALIVLSWF